MRLFVSYSRIDNPESRLREIEDIVTAIGDPYIDDLHFDPNVDRGVSVMAALELADGFVAVITANYLRSAWTNKEFDLAVDSGKPLYALIGSTLVTLVEATFIRDAIEPTLSTPGPSTTKPP
jgi:hypothetical protein